MSSLIYFLLRPGFMRIRTSKQYKKLQFLPFATIFFKKTKFSDNQLKRKRRSESNSNEGIFFWKFYFFYLYKKKFLKIFICPELNKTGRNNSWPTASAAFRTSLLAHSPPPLWWLLGSLCSVFECMHGTLLFEAGRSDFNWNSTLKGSACFNHMARAN